MCNFLFILPSLVNDRRTATPWRSSNTEKSSIKIKKCLKQGKCSICSIFFGHVQKKCLKQGKCSICSICSIFWGNFEHGFNMEGSPKKLNILNILNISPVLSTFFEHGPKRLNILSISPCFKHFSNFDLCFQGFFLPPHPLPLPLAFLSVERAWGV